MGKRNRDKNYEKRLKEGRGRGTLESYKPWILIQDCPSEGTCSRILGITTKRQHDLLSNLEKMYFYFLDFSSNVVDIREQYPLLPIEETILIAKELGIEHPKNPKTKALEAMTTDFLITLIDDSGETIEVARTIKPKEKLLDKRVLEKFEIERQYFKKRGIDWGIVTEEELDESIVMFIEDLYDYQSLENKESFKDISSEILDDMKLFFINQCSSYESSLNDLCYYFDKTFNLSLGSGIAMFKHLLISKNISVNIFNNLDFKNNIEIRINDLSDDR